MGVGEVLALVFVIVEQSPAPLSFFYELIDFGLILSSVEYSRVEWGQRKWHPIGFWAEKFLLTNSLEIAWFTLE